MYGSGHFLGYTETAETSAELAAGVYLISTLYPVGIEQSFDFSLQWGWPEGEFAIALGYT